jgi:dihydroorotate dehydrogenase
MLYRLTRRALFQLDAEQAHDWAIARFRDHPVLSTLPFLRPAVEDPVSLLGLRFPNRIGLAAGLDKNGECLKAWSRLGFGFVEIGTTTPLPQPGNPRPRLFRLTEQEALINRLGFNNKGVDALTAEVDRAAFTGILGINIGKNADTPIDRAADDYVICLEKVYTRASYVTVNISSPNTRNLRELQGDEALRALLQALASSREQLRQRHGKHTPLLVKIAPDLDATVLPGLAAIVREAGMDGLIATNTTLARPGLEGTRWAEEAGGLSGRPLRPYAEACLAALRHSVGPDFPLIGVGGIMSPEDAVARRRMGADLLQVYTGFIYGGPPVIRAMARAVAATHQTQ